MGITMKKEKCMKCGYEWVPRTENPKACPNCKRYNIDKPKSRKEKTANA